MLNSKVPHARLIERQIRDVRAATDAGNLLSALALALTFPDVFGNAMYPDLTKSQGQRNVGAQYARWFDEYVSAKYQAPAESGSGELECYFTGRMCWKLRCAYLHEGKSDAEYPYEHFDDREGMKHELEVELALYSCDGVGNMTDSARPNVSYRHVRIDIVKLCTCLCDAAERCLRDSSELFGATTSDILDLPYVIELCGLRD